MTTGGKKVSSRGSENERFTAALSYVWILCLYPLLFKRDSAFIRFHAKQGLALFVIEILSSALFIFSWIIIIPCIIIAVIGVKQALAGKYWVMPFIGDWIKKLNV